MLLFALLLVAVSTTMALPGSTLSGAGPEVELGSVTSPCEAQLLINETFATPEPTSPEWEVAFAGFEVKSNAAQVHPLAQPHFNVFSTISHRFSEVLTLRKRTEKNTLRLRIAPNPSLSIADMDTTRHCPIPAWIPSFLTCFERVSFFFLLFRTFSRTFFLDLFILSLSISFRFSFPPMIWSRLALHWICVPLYTDLPFFS